MGFALIEEIKLQDGNPVEGDEHFGIGDRKGEGKPPGLFLVPFGKDHFFDSDIFAQIKAKRDREEKIQYQSENRVSKNFLGAEIDHASYSL
jgi:hypothetical protein